MHLSELMDPGKLEAALHQGNVLRKQHPNYRLSLYDYTRQCQFRGDWDEVTMNCRGLIVEEKTLKVIARPFPKFFNYADHTRGYSWAPPLPERDPQGIDVYDKLDGSLGIIYHYAGRWHAATRGSFASEQALWAQARLDALTPDGMLPTWMLIPGYTYLCEIIYPGNRIVVDYQGSKSLTLLAVYGPDGREERINPLGWRPLGPIVKHYPSLPLNQLVHLTDHNTWTDQETKVTGTDHEGFVIRFRSSGVRVKVKYREYVRLHKILTEVNSRDVWRALGVKMVGPGETVKRMAQNFYCSPEEMEALMGVSDPMGGILDAVPDEFYQWVHDMCDMLMLEAGTLTAQIHQAWQELEPLRENRRQFAAAAREYAPNIEKGLFILLDGGNVAMHVWHVIKPKTALPFREDESE